jgi:hypothetical protein
MSDKIDIVDRLTIALDEVSGEVARQHEFTGESLPQLLMDARDELHRLQGMVYSLPPQPPHLVDGTTWREEYEHLWDRLMRMSGDDFLHWQSVMKD